MLGLSYFAVVGDSMHPTLRAGDWILVRTNGRASQGDVVALNRPDRPELLIVKRVTRIVGEGFWVEGDNPTASTDSRQFGPAARVVGRAFWRVRPWGRIH